MKFTSLKELFKDLSFQTPDYQRGYAWGKEQINDFLEDIGRIGPDNPEHFTGTLILEIGKDNNGCGLSVIVDGQQRLTTALLLLSAVSDAFKHLGDIGKAQEIRSEYLGTSTKPKFRYSASHDSWPFLAFHVLKDDGFAARASGISSAYAQNLELALNTFNNFLKDYPNEDLNNLCEKVTTKLLFNVVDVDPIKFNIHVAFETINNRGKPLTLLERLKNRLIYISSIISESCFNRGLSNSNSRDDLRNLINSSWSDIYSWLGRYGKEPLDDDDFLRNHSLIYFSVDSSDAAWLNSLLFKDEFTADRAISGILTVHYIEKYLQSISIAAVVWSHIRRPRDLPLDHLKWLVRLEHVHRPAFNPLILAAYMRILRNNPNIITDLRKISKVQAPIVQLLIEIERFIVLIYEVSGRKSNTRRKSFYSWAYRLYNEKLGGGNDSTVKSSIEYVARFIRACVNNWQEPLNSESEYIDSEFEIDGWIDLNTFESQIKTDLQKNDGYYGRSFTRLVLFEYEEWLREKHGGDIKVEWASVGSQTIEHIYPQEASKWSQFNEAIGHGNKKASINSYCHSLGNLILLSRSKNSSLQNNPYKGTLVDGAKRARFNLGGSYSENDVALNYSSWTPKTVEARGKILLQFAEQRWDFKFSTYGVRKLRDLLVID